MIRHHGRFCACLNRDLLEEGYFIVRVGIESIDRHDYGNAESPGNTDMGDQVRCALLEAGKVLLDKFRGERLACDDPSHPSVHLERPDRGNDHNAIGRETAGPALDIHEFLHADVGSEPRFGHDILTQSEGDLIGDHARVSMGDVGEWSGVHKCRRVLERLQQRRHESILHENGHGAGYFQVVGRHRLAVEGCADNDPSQPRSKVQKVGGESENGHDLRSNGDIEPRLPWVAVDLSAQADDDAAQRPIVQVDYPGPGDRERIEIQLVSMGEVVVDGGGKEIVRSRYGVDVAGEVQIEVFHRDDLAVTPPGRPSFDTERWTHARLPDGGEYPVAQPTQALAETNGRGRFALAEWSRGDGGDIDVLAKWPVGEFVPDIEVNLGLVAAVQLEVLRFQSDPLRNRQDRLNRGLLGDIEIARHRCAGWEIVAAHAHGGSVRTVVLRV